VLHARSPRGLKASWTRRYAALKDRSSTVARTSVADQKGIECASPRIVLLVEEPAFRPAFVATLERALAPVA
jgi:hypothetical protein